MVKACDYTIHGHHHHGWDHSIPPAQTVAPGSRVYFHCLDSSAGQLTRQSTVADVAAMDFGKINPVTGPVYVDGAEPGDVLKITLEQFHPSGFGWTANIPGFGLLTDQSGDPHLKVWEYEPDTLAPALFSVGDTHAAQGDGEVCGTAFESPIDVEITLDLIKQEKLEFPRFSTPRATKSRPGSGPT